MRFHQAQARKKKQAALFRLFTWTTLIGVACGAWAVVPLPERLLPDDTLVLVTAPDFAKLKEIWSRLPQSQCLNDPAMKFFKEKFLNKWKEEFKDLLERELSIKFDSYTELLQG